MYISFRAYVSSVDSAPNKVRVVRYLPMLLRLFPWLPPFSCLALSYCLRRRQYHVGQSSCSILKSERTTVLCCAVLSIKHCRSRDNHRPFCRFKERDIPKLSLFDNSVKRFVIPSLQYSYTTEKTSKARETISTRSSYL
jgi:hypothetical protein